MKNFLFDHLTLRQLAILYKFRITIEDMNFSYMPPMFIGSVLSVMLIIRSIMPQSQIMDMSSNQIGLFYTVLIFLAVMFLVTLRPFLRRRIARIKVYFYRRKKRATTTLFF